MDLEVYGLRGSRLYIYTNAASSLRKYDHVAELGLALHEVIVGRSKVAERVLSDHGLDTCIRPSARVQYAQ